MKLFVAIFLFALVAIATAKPQNMEEKVEKVVNFINNFQGSRDELEKALIAKMDEKAKTGKTWKDEEVAKFLEMVVPKLNGKVISGEEFKSFIKAQVAARKA